MLQVGVNCLQIIVCTSREAEESLRALGLGSCIGIAVWDPVARVGGMAHVVLPESAMSSLGSPPGKYADARQKKDRTASVFFVCRSVTERCVRQRAVLWALRTQYSLPDQ